MQCQIRGCTIPAIEERILITVDNVGKSGVRPPVCLNISTGWCRLHQYVNSDYDKLVNFIREYLPGAQ